MTGSFEQRLNQVLPRLASPDVLPPTALAEYQAWLVTVKHRIVLVRLRMALAASRELIQFYWDLGALIAHKQAQSQWGDKLIAQLSADLQKTFPEIKGLSASNLKYCLRFFHFYTSGQGASDLEVAAAAAAAASFGQQPVDQLPWGHNILIFTKCSSVEVRGRRPLLRGTNAAAGLEPRWR